MTADQKLDRLIELVQSIDDRVGNLEPNVSGLMSDMAEVKTTVTSIDTRLTKVELTLESDIAPALKVLSEGYGITTGKLDTLQTLAESTQSDLDIVRAGVSVNSGQIIKLQAIPD